MKHLFLVVMAIILICSCTGEQGPMGPSGAEGQQGETGPQGDSGPQGSPGIPGDWNCVVLTGTVSNSMYELDNSFSYYVSIFDDAIKDNQITQLYFSTDANVYAWWSESYWQLTNGVIYINDPQKDLLGFDYMILIADGN